jgi:hypothetical protein
MKLAFFAVLLLVVLWLAAALRSRAARQAAEQSRARARSVARRQRVPVVSNNVRGVAASQTIAPLGSQSGGRDDAGEGDR